MSSLTPFASTAATLAKPWRCLTHSVTFNVDMSEQTVSGAVYIAGATIDGWAGSQVELTDADGDNVYSVTLELPQGNHEYKFMIGSWDASEQFDEAGRCRVHPHHRWIHQPLARHHVRRSPRPRNGLLRILRCLRSGEQPERKQTGFSFRVFPSVTDGIVTVAFPAPLADVAQIEVRDMSGRLVHNTNAGSWNHAVVPRLEQ